MSVLPTEVPSSAQCGFTLTEMAVVLVIIALLIGGMLMPLTAQQDIRAMTETQNILGTAQEALLGYAAIQGRLPCPATPASNGKADPEGGGACNCVSPNCFLPAVSLGITPIDASGLALDSWNNPIRYAVTAANGNVFTTANGLRPFFVPGSATTPAPDLKVCSNNSCNPPLTERAVALVWSTGKNALGTGGSGNDERENPNPHSASTPDPTPNTFVSHQPTGDFDDILAWLSEHVLYSRLIAAGRLP